MTAQEYDPWVILASSDTALLSTPQKQACYGLHCLSMLVSLSA